MNHHDSAVDLEQACQCSRRPTAGLPVQKAFSFGTSSFWHLLLIPKASSFDLNLAYRNVTVRWNGWADGLGVQ
jgi:hypothetical protein